jgi:hypothetical protein
MRRGDQGIPTGGILRCVVRRSRSGKTVTVAGSDLDGAAIRAAIEDAGYDIA